MINEEIESTMTKSPSLMQSNENNDVKKSPLRTSFLWAIFACLISIFVVPEFIEVNTLLLSISASFATFLISLFLCNYLEDDEQGESFDFYKVTDKIDQPNIFDDDVLQVSKPVMDTPFLIDEDGLDPSIVFNVEKTGAGIVILIEEIYQDNNLQDYLQKHQIDVKLIGSPIEGVRLMEMQYKGLQGYYRVTDNYHSSYSNPTCNIDFAFLLDTEVLRLQVEKAILQMLDAHPPASVKKLNAKNYQAMFKFYTYVNRLGCAENRSVDHLCFYHGTFEISNSSYVELYNCNLKSSLTSWVNKDGLIRTDYIDEEEDELSASDKEALQTTIGLPFAKCRLIGIKLVALPEDSLSVKLHLSFAELIDDEPTGKNDSLAIVMQDKNILISRDEEETNSFVTVSEYFDEKTIIPFYPAA